MLNWNGAWLTVEGQVFATVDPAVFLAGLKDADAPKAMLTSQSTAPGGDGPPIMVWKSHAMIEQLAGIIDQLQPRCIVELGIATGGSAALLAALAPNAKVVAVDIAPDAPALSSHIEYWGLESRLRPYFEVDQGDRETLRRIIFDEFGDEPIDLVIDDASHQLDLSRASMEILFPRVRPGGCYIVEDWAWSHIDLRAVLPDAPVPEGRPLTILIVEMLMALGTGRGEVVRVDCADTVRVWRGPTPLDPDGWSVAGAYFSSSPVVAE